MVALVYLFFAFTAAGLAYIGFPMIPEMIFASVLTYHFITERMFKLTYGRTMTDDEGKKLMIRIFTGSKDHG